MFYSMIDKFIMSQWQNFPIFWQQASHVEYTLFLSTLPTRLDNFDFKISFTTDD